MKKLTAVLMVILMLLPAFCSAAEEATAVTDSLSLSLPSGIIAFTAEEAIKNEQISAVLEAVSDNSENLYIGALKAEGERVNEYSVVYIIQREPEAAAETGVSEMGTYKDVNEFARGVAEWYKTYYPDFYVVDVLSGVGGVPVIIVHIMTADGVALLAETYSTDYSDTIIACFFGEEGEAVEPTQEQYEAFSAMLKTVSVK